LIYRRRRQCLAMVRGALLKKLMENDEIHFFVYF
jgi:hypothetical protein